MNLTLVVILALTAAVAWWLSGRDSAVTGENKAADLKRRVWRCGVTLLLVWAAGASVQFGGQRGGFVLIAVALPLAILWAGCLSELFAGGVHRLIDSEDTREFEPDQQTRDLDRLAELVRTGRNERALKLCADLLNSREVSALAMDAILFQVYRQAFTEARLLTFPHLAEARLLCGNGKGLEAASRLEELLRLEPRNLSAALMLLRIYTRDPALRDRAETLLQTLKRNPGMPPGFIDFARHSLREWLANASGKEQSAEGIESLLVDKKALAPPKP